MQKSTETKKSAVLTDRQKELVSLMKPVVQEYYKSKNPSGDEIEGILADNMEELQKIMGKILGGIINKENEKIIQAIEEYENSPYSAY